MKSTSSPGKSALFALAALTVFCSCGEEAEQEWCTWGEHVCERLCCAIVPSRTRSVATDVFSGSRDLSGEAGDSLMIVCDTDENWPCPWGQHICGNKCADFKTDDFHCGKCDNPCGAGESCTDGICQ
jgi:hypothetical protein